MKEILEKIWMDDVLRRFFHWEVNKIPWYRSNWEQPRKTHTPDVIYVLESGFRSSSFEGKRLYEALRDSDGNAVYMGFESIESFARCIVEIMKDFESRVGKINAMPFIHLSAHAQESGILIENGESISWVDLFESLNFIRTIFPSVLLPKPYDQLKIPAFSLMLSTCHGRYFADLLSSKSEFPVQNLIYYPVELDSTIAYDAFHNFYLKERYFPKDSFSARINAINSSLSTRFTMISHPDLARR